MNWIKVQSWCNVIPALCTFISWWLTLCVDARIVVLWLFFYTDVTHAVALWFFICMQFKFLGPVFFDLGRLYTFLHDIETLIFNIYIYNITTYHACNILL